MVKTNQFSVTKHKRVIRQVSGEHGLPGIVFVFAHLIINFIEPLSPLQFMITPPRLNLKTGMML